MHDHSSQYDKLLYNKPGVSRYIVRDRKRSCSHFTKVEEPSLKKPNLGELIKKCSSPENHQRVSI